MEGRLVDHMGSDLSVVNAARVSFAKTSEWDVVPGRWLLSGRVCRRLGSWQYFSLRSHDLYADPHW